MHRRRHVVVEQLESRCLLSGIAATLTTNVSVYVPGQPVTITLVETNTSKHAVKLAVGPSIDGFTVSQNNVELWRSNEGVQPLYVLLKTLKPGQSYTETATWNGQFDEAQPSNPLGPFVIRAETSNAAPVTLNAAITDTLSTDKSVYQTGEPVTITLVQKNTSSQPENITIGPSIDGFTVSQNGIEVWRSNEGPQSDVVMTRTLQPGESYIETATWNGQFDEGKPSNAFGPFVIKAETSGAAQVTVHFAGVQTVTTQANTSHHVALNGQISGSWGIVPVPSDSGETELIHGSGKIRPLGEVNATGSLHGTGLIANGHAGGTVTMSNTKGSVTVLLTGPTQPAFTGIPSHFSFKIVSGTGQYALAKDQGKATLFEAVADPAGPTNAGVIIGPIFTLTLRSK